MNYNEKMNSRDVVLENFWSKINNSSKIGKRFLINTIGYNKYNRFLQQARIKENLEWRKFASNLYSEIYGEREKSDYKSFNPREEILLKEEANCLEEFKGLTKKLREYHNDDISDTNKKEIEKKLNDLLQQIQKVSNRIKNSRKKTE